MDTSQAWECAARLCLHRVAMWDKPPNWSTTDWMEEMRAEAELASWFAYTTCRLEEPHHRFRCAYQHALNACLNRYRQEWRYAFHCVNCGDVYPALDGYAEHYEGLLTAIESLSPSDQYLLRALFWEGYSETEVAIHEGVSVQAVSKRKKAALRRLREMMGKG